MPQFSIQNYPCKDLRMYGRIPGRKDNRNYPRMCPDKGQRSKETKGRDVSTEKMSTQKQSIGSKKEAWCRTARYRKWKRHGSRREQQEEASGPEATWAFTAQCSCLTLMGVNILPHR